MTDQPTDLRDRIVAAMRRAPFEDLRPDWNAPNGPLKITARIDDLADAVLAELRTVPVVPVSSPPPDQTRDRDRYAEVTAAARAEANRLALSESLGLGTGAPWAAIRERVAALAVLPPPADRAAVLHEAADRYAKLVDENEAYDREHGQLDETARVQHGAVRDVVVGLRRLAAEAQQPDTRPLVRPDGPTPEEWQGRAKQAEAAVNRARAALNDCKARGATGMQYERAVAVALGDRKPVQGPGPLCHESDPVTLRECALRARHDGDHEDGDLRWPAVPPQPVHKGGNADDCPACQTDGLDTIGPPYECPGDETAASSEETQS